MSKNQFDPVPAPDGNWIIVAVLATGEADPLAFGPLSRSESLKAVAELEADGYVAEAIRRAEPYGCASIGGLWKGDEARAALS